MATHIINEEHLSFNDILLRPQYSEVRSRDDVSLVTELSSGLKLDIPVLAANMDTVCGLEMAGVMGEL
ncbi:MAG TPA: guanosine monophosphate reductase, partial [Dehalococcoidia bacterium]|nr:guanosine monophosphate reductase [Dehalococcoidia bacterium]